MIQLLTCPNGHFWETTEREGNCPSCGEPAESLPLLDLEPTGPVIPPPPVEGVEPEFIDAQGRAMVAGFQVLEVLGKGPTGLRLFKAKHALTGRTVLLEVVLAREDTSQHAWSSLRSQAAALSRLSHPGIIGLLEVGERERQLFYNALQWVEGGTLSQKVANQPLPAAQILRLGEMLARTVEDAHAMSVLHRGLRPGLIVLQPTSLGKNLPDRNNPPGMACTLHGGAFIPRIDGYGLVRRPVEGEAADMELYDNEPGFVSPEQAWGRVKDLGPHTDVWGLGAILFFLVTGKAPFEGNVEEVLEAARGDDVAWPRSLHRCGAGLATVIGRCLQRAPQRRYRSSGDLADDLRRLSLGIPIAGQHEAGISGWTRRNPGIAGMIVLGVLGVAGTVIGYINGTSGTVAARREADRLKTIADRAEQRVAILERDLKGFRARARFQDYQQAIALAAADIKLGDPVGRGQGLLARMSAEDRGFEWTLLSEQAAGRGRSALPPFVGGVALAALDPSGRHVAVATPVVGKSLDLWHVPTKTRLLQLGQIERMINAVAFSPTGVSIAAVGGDGRDDGIVKAWSLGEGPGRGRALFARRVSDRPLTGLAFRPDGEQLGVIAEDNEILVLSMVDGEAKVKFGQRMGAFGRPRRLLAWLDKGSVAAGASDSSDLKHHDAVTGRIKIGYSMPSSVVALASHVGRATGDSLLAAAGSDRTIQVYRIWSGPPAGNRPAPTSLKAMAVIGPLESQPRQLAFSPGAKRLAVALDGGSVGLYTQVGDAWARVHAFSADGTQGLAFSSSGESLMTAGTKEVVVWGRIGN